jgi:hypothetical protein
LGIDLETMADHHDLMHDCWRCNLFGGFRLFILSPLITLLLSHDDYLPISISILSLKRTEN